MKAVQIVRDPKVSYIVRSAMGFNSYTFEGGDAEERAKNYVRGRSDARLTIVKQTITEEEVAL